MRCAAQCARPWRRPPPSAAPRPSGSPLCRCALGWSARYSVSRVGACESCDSRLGWLIVACQQRMLSGAVCHASALKRRARRNPSSQPEVRVDAECRASAVWLAAVAVHTHLCTLLCYQIPAFDNEQRIGACCLDTRVNGCEEKLTSLCVHGQASAKDVRAAKDTAAATAVKGRRLEERVQNLEASLAGARPGPGPQSMAPSLLSPTACGAVRRRHGCHESVLPFLPLVISLEKKAGLVPPHNDLTGMPA